MKKLIMLFLLLLSITVQAQTVIYFPVILKDGDVAIDPRLVITDGTIEVDLLEGGWELANPYWNPKVSQYKGGGTMVNAQLAEGQRMVHREYDNVIETIPLSLRGVNQAQAMKTAHNALALLRQAGDYWTQPYEYDPVWIEVKLPCNACLTGYSRIVKGTIPELTNPFGQPFFSNQNQSVMEGITLTIEREPFWSIVPPGSLIGPLYNLIDNPDFELWNFGIADSQPDSWTNIETTHIVGQNGRDQTLPKFGQYALKVRVSGSTLAGASKGITQVISDTALSTTYTVIAWVRSEGVSNGVGRILINYSDQMELYRSSTSHGWTLYTQVITTSTSENEVSISIEILTTAANTDGTIYVDGLMFVEGNWEQEAIDNVLPYMSGSHIVNHWDQPGGAIVAAGDINYVDVWNVPGNVSSLIRLIMQNNQTPADSDAQVEIYSQIRIGMRRSGNIFNFANYHDPSGVSDTTGSSDDRINSGTLTGDWTDITTHLIANNVIDNEGRYRVYARIYDTLSSGDSTLEVRIKYFVGDADGAVKILTSILPSVLSSWTILDLTSTQAAVLDKKNSPVIPAQLGYTIQMRRTTGSDQVRFDYTMLMPTDGGFIEATLNTPLTYGNSLSVDNTNLNISVEATTQPSNIWIEDFTPGSAAGGIQVLGEYKGNLYGGAGTLTDGEIYQRKNGIWSKVFTSAATYISGIASFGVYNGILYAGSSSTAPATGTRILSTTDGISWTEAHTPVGNFSVSDLIAFNGLLWAASWGTAKAVEYFDGSTWTTSKTFPAAIANTQKMAVYNNKLYLVTNDGVTGNVEEYDPATDTWTRSLDDSIGIALFNTAVFKGRLFVTGEQGYLYVFDGNAWTASVISSGNTLMVVHPFNDKLYIVDYDGTLFESVDGDTWTVSLSQIRASTVVAGDMIEFEGLLFFSDRQSVYNFSPQGISRPVSDFKGTPFLAPPRKSTTDLKRHRYFFSYDREDFVNDLDDAALIGIGFVPRYLELPMSEK